MIGSFFTFRKEFVVLLLVYVGVVGVVLWEIPGDDFRVSFLDVGQGDSIFVRTPENHQILIDGGADKRVLEQLSSVMPFADRSIDMIILTHPDYDHMGGLEYVLDSYDVENILITGVMSDKDIYFNFLEKVDREVLGGGGQNGAQVFIAESGVDFRFGRRQSGTGAGVPDGVFVDVLYPFENLSFEEMDDVNESSIVIMVEGRGRKILLTGDAGVELEEELLMRYSGLDADILKAGHHGSKNSSGERFLRGVGADFFVIQVGENNYGHPNKEVLDIAEQAGIKKIRRTDLDGRIDFVF